MPSAPRFRWPSYESLLSHDLQSLSERDLEIMRLLAEGLGLAEIADALGVGYKTIANACNHIKAKLGVTRTNDLVRLAMTLGIA
jgi:DNA-binding CsgD family transcriptional regulator